MCGVKGYSFTDFVSQTARLGVFKFNKYENKINYYKLKKFF